MENDYEAEKKGKDWKEVNRYNEHQSTNYEDSPADVLGHTSSSEELINGRYDPKNSPMKDEEEDEDREQPDECQPHRRNKGHRRTNSAVTHVTETDIGSLPPKDRYATPPICPPLEGGRRHHVNGIPPTPNKSRAVGLDRLVRAGPPAIMFNGYDTDRTPMTPSTENIVEYLAADPTNALDSSVNDAHNGLFCLSGEFEPRHGSPTLLTRGWMRQYGISSLSSFSRVSSEAMAPISRHGKLEINSDSGSEEEGTSDLGQVKQGTQLEEVEDIEKKPTPLDQEGKTTDKSQARSDRQAHMDVVNGPAMRALMRARRERSSQNNGSNDEVITVDFFFTLRL